MTVLQLYTARMEKCAHGTSDFVTILYYNIHIQSTLAGKISFRTAVSETH